MCGRYAIQASGPIIAARFSATPSQVAAEFQPRFNIAPTQSIPVVVGREERQLEMMQWGLIPSWSKEPKANYSTINARAEGLEDKPAYRKPLRSQRCLVPATGFYEWNKPVGSKEKIPYHVRLKSLDGNPQLFALAGLYDIWRGPDGKELKTYTIVTTEANELIKPLHERMAVILPPELEEAWLDPRLTEPAQILPLLKPYPPELMEAYTVSSQVNSTAHEGPHLLDPVGYGSPQSALSLWDEN
jgi:putative SOS response-associated peptidase YedK